MGCLKIVPILLLTCWLFITAVSSYSSDPYCPKGCACSPSHKQKYYTSVKCTSQDIFTKFCLYDVKQPLHLVNVDLSATHIKTLNIRTINKLLHLHTLDVSGNYLTDLMHDLKTPELRHIDLSNNRIKYISSTFFPKNIRTINLANNMLQTFPQNIQHLPHLHELKITGNTLECNCYNWEIYEALILKAVLIDNNECLNYGDVQIYKWFDIKNSLTCSGSSDMLGDEPGSGDGKVLDYDSDSERNEDDPEEFIRVEHETTKSHSTTHLPSNVEPMTERTTTESDFGFDELVTVPEKMFEGSGMVPVMHEGSGFEDFNLTSWINAPIGSGDGSDDEDDITNGTITVEGSIVNNESNFSDIREATTPTDATEPIIIVGKAPDLQKAKNPNQNDDHINEELGEQVSTSQEYMSSGFYIFLGIVVVILIMLIMYLIITHQKSDGQSQNNNRRPRGNQDEEIGSELKELEKIVPLLNQENGKAKPLSINETTPMIPLIDAEDPQDPPYNTEGSEPSENDRIEPAPSEQPRNSYDPERVKIVMTELSDSIPKTPVLITRSRSPNGTEEIHVLPNRSS